TAATGATAAAPAVTAAAAAAAPAVFPGLGLVDGQRPALKLGAVEGVDGLLGLGVIIHFDEPEAARTAGLAVGDDLGAGDFPVLLEKGQQVVGAGIPNEIANVNVLRHRKKPFVPGLPQTTPRRTGGGPEGGPRPRPVRDRTGVRRLGRG